MHKQIKNFLEKKHQMFLATVKDNEPFICTLYYTFYEPDSLILFKSDVNSNHSKNVLINKKVAICINNNTNMLIKSKSLQIKGEAALNNNANLEKYYLNKFPMAKIFKNSQLFAIKIKTAKLTDNTLGIANKIEENYFEEELVDKLKLRTTWNN